MVVVFIAARSNNQKRNKRNLFKEKLFTLVKMHSKINE